MQAEGPVDTILPFKRQSTLFEIEIHVFILTFLRLCVIYKSVKMNNLFPTYGVD